MRVGKIDRKTAETDISIKLDIDGGGVCEIDTGCGFLDHMLTLFASHGRFDLRVKCVGDLRVDYHHTVEDIGICLGRAFVEAGGECRGITRYGSVILPMDEALILCATDISGRGMVRWDVRIPTEKVGKFDTELVAEFWTAFARSSGCTIHFRMLDGENSHHIIEAVFKAASRSLRASYSKDLSLGEQVPSTKGVL